MRLSTWTSAAYHFGGGVLLLLVPILALTCFSPQAVRLVPTASPSARSAAVAAAPSDIAAIRELLADWSETAAAQSSLNPDASAEASKVTQEITQQLAAMQNVANQLTDATTKGSITIEATAFKTNLQAFKVGVLKNTGPKGLSAYNLAHARSSGLHITINQLRGAIKQLTNQLAAQIIAQDLNLKYEQVRTLDLAYRSLTGQHAHAGTILSKLATLDRAISQSDMTALAAQQQQATTGNLLQSNASPFTFSASSQP